MRRYYSTKSLRKGHLQLRYMAQTISPIVSFPIGRRVSSLNVGFLDQKGHRAKDLDIFGQMAQLFSFGI
jgi:hypothetical protein